MRKLAAAIVLAVVLGLPNPAQAGWRSTECRFQTRDGHRGWTVDEVKSTIRCLAPRFGIDVGMALLVAEHESGFRAVTPYDSHCGVYQHKRTYFDGRLDNAERRWPRYAWFGQRCENARSNIFAAFELVVETGGWYDHWCRWTTYC
jgi:hypothetical protein